MSTHTRTCVHAHTHEFANAHRHVLSMCRGVAYDLTKYNETHACMGECIQGRGVRPD